MNGESHEQTIRRILVALDVSPHSLAALEAAVELAASLHAELVGLFVEDESLLRTVGLPYAREYGVYSARSREIDLAELEQQLRGRAGQARRSLMAAAQRRQVQWTFRVARGAVTAHLLAAAGEVDLITLGRAGWSLPGGGRRLGSSARAILAETPGLTLVLERGVRLGLPVVVLYDGSPLSRRALTVAANLARVRCGSKLNVLIQVGGGQSGQELQDEVVNWLQGQGLEARLQRVLAGDAAALMAAVRNQGCGLLVVAGLPMTLAEDGLLEHLHELGCPALVVQ
jgi:nucleotide-binding universal stress UspA family protein